MRTIGDLYNFGFGVDQNYKLAAHWYEKAAEQGNPEAQNNLGFCYEIGKGVEQDYNQALDWYKKAADKASTSAKEAVERLTKSQI